MAIYLTDNFKLGVKRLLDERTNISTLQELEDMATTFIPYGLIVHCDEDDNMYKFINDNGVDKWITLTMSIESLFFEYNNETEKYDIPIYVHNPKVIEHPIEEINDWIGIKDNSHKFDTLSKFINNDIIVDEKTWNTLKFSEYKEEMYDKYVSYVENHISMVTKPTYSKVDSEEDMIESGKFYIMDPDNSGNYIIFVVTEDGETLSISSTNIDMSDYQKKQDENLETDSKYILEAINEVYTLYSDQRDFIGANDLITGLDGSNCTILQYISDIYNKYIKFIGSNGNLITDDKTSLVNAMNEIMTKLGDLKDVEDLIEKSSFVNTVNALHEISQIKVGTIISYAGSVPPAGYVMCDGSAYSPSDYPDLYDVIGSMYGTTSEGKFKVPDLRGRTILGTPQLNWVGDFRGAKTVQLFNENIPSHNHTIASQTHKHSDTATDSTSRTCYKCGSKNGDDGNNGKTCKGDTYTATGSHTHDWHSNCSASHTHTCYYNEGGYNHNNLMPYVVLNYIIKC